MIRRLLFILNMDQTNGKNLDDSSRIFRVCFTVLCVWTRSGHDFVVSAGRTLLLPCSSADKPKQRWFHRRKRGRREPIFTRYQNGTVKPEREGNRLSFSHDALQILNLQPEDAGEYQCRELKVRLAVRTGGSQSRYTFLNFIKLQINMFLLPNV